MNVNVSIPFNLRETGLLYGRNNCVHSHNNSHEVDPPPEGPGLPWWLGAVEEPSQYPVLVDGLGCSGYPHHNGPNTFHQNSHQGNGPLRDRLSRNPRFPRVFEATPETSGRLRKPPHKGAAGPGSCLSNTDIDAGFECPTGQPRDMPRICEEDIFTHEETRREGREEGPKWKVKGVERNHQANDSQFMPFSDFWKPGKDGRRWPEPKEAESRDPKANYTQDFQQTVLELLERLEGFRKHMNVGSNSRDSPRTFNGPHGYCSLYGSHACGDSRHNHFDLCSSPSVFNKFASVTDAQSGSQVKMCQGSRDQFSS